MDPFVEDQEWEDSHSRFNTATSDALAPRVDPRYIVRIERRVYVEHGLGEEDQVQERRGQVAQIVGYERSPARALQREVVINMQLRAADQLLGRAVQPNGLRIAARCVRHRDDKPVKR
jgi:hypothetical protein